MTAPPQLPDGLLLECLVTTLNPAGEMHVSPMGPIMDNAQQNVLLRPYAPSKTLENLQFSGSAVMHVTDDAALMARLAIGAARETFASQPTPDGRGRILRDACYWRQLEVVSVDTQPAPCLVHCRVTNHGRLRDFIGFNRAKHALLEAAILATRIDYLPHQDIWDQLKELAVPVDKTGGTAERQAFEQVQTYLESRLPTESRQP